MSNTCKGRVNRKPCEVEIDHGSLCMDCRDDLVRLIVDISAHHADLAVVRARLTRYSTGRSASRSAETPLPYDARFSPRVDSHGNPRPGRGTELLTRSKALITGWTQVVAAAHPTPAPAGPACLRCNHPTCNTIRNPNPPWTGTVNAGCLYLIQHADWIRTGTHGGHIHNDMSRLAADLESIVDRPADGWFAGICAAPIKSPDHGTIECPHELYATQKTGRLRCAACRTVHDVAHRRQLLLLHAENILATATEIAHAVAAWADHDQPAKRIVDRIWTWTSRGQLSQCGTIHHAGRERPLYRMGDVLELLTRARQREAKTRSKPAARFAS